MFESELLTQGFSTLLNNPQALLFATFGVMLGIVIGALPGLTATMGVAILLPFTYGMEPVSGLLMICGVFFGGVYGGSITAILLKIPGTPAAAATAIDGYELTKQGSSMHASERLMSALYWGYDENTLYLRLDCARPCDQFLSPGDVLYVDLVGEIEQRLVITPETGQGLLLNRADQGYHEQDVKLQVGVGGIVELGIPLLALKPAATGRWYLVLTLLSAEQLRGRWPSDGSIVLPYEGAALELNDWIV